MREIINHWRFELEQVFRDIGVILFFLVVPFVYPILYGIIYNTETTHEVPMVVVDQSLSSYSRDFIRRNDASPEVKVVAIAANMDEAIKMINEKEAYGIMVIPPDFSKSLHSKRVTEIKLYCDMSSFLHYKALLLTATEASINMGKEIKVSENSLGSRKADEITNSPVNYESIALYNTQNGFATFLLPAILIMVIQQTLLLGVSMLAGTRRSTRNYVPDSGPFSRQRILVGKALAYATIYIVVCFWALVVVPYIFKLPQMASFRTIIQFTTPYLFACIFFAMTVASFVKSREIPMMILVFTSLPLLFISGISWPGSSVPAFWEWVSYLFPSTFGIRGFIKINSTGAGMDLLSFEYLMLWVQTFVYAITTFLLYQRKSLWISKK